MVAQFGLLSGPQNLQIGDATQYLQKQALNNQTLRANNTSEQANQLKMQAHKLDTLKQLAGSVKDDAGLARAKSFARSMGIGDDILGQLGDSYEQAKPLLDSFYANSDAAKTELANQFKMLEMGMKQQELQMKQQERLPTDAYGRPIAPPELQGDGAFNNSDSLTETPLDKGMQLSDDPAMRGGERFVGPMPMSNAPKANPLDDVIMIGKKPFSKTTLKPLSGKESNVPVDIQIANMLSDPNVPEATKENLRFAIRQTADQAGDIASAKKVGEGEGTAKVDFKIVKANFPQLIKQTQRIQQLAKSATYTAIGKATVAALRQSGEEVPQGAEDAAAYQAAVKLAIFPTLRATFGAQFTAGEGDALITTLGNPDLSPPEKDAIVQQFVLNEVDKLQTKANEAGEDFNAEEYYQQVLGDLSSQQATPTTTATKNATSMPTDKAKLVKGQSYRTPRGVAVWDGEKFNQE